MNQIGNIFRKDLRRHWPEVAASLLLMIGFVWAEMRRWDRQSGALEVGGGVGVLEDLLLQYVAPATITSWMFLIVRAVQGESLVGDRQFWVTRPYDWRKLATAKVLFVLAFVNLPLLVIDLFLLAKSGFAPFSYLSGLLWMQSFWVAILLLPTAALAAVTASIAQLLLALLLIVLGVIGLSALGGVIPDSNFGSDNGWLYFVLVMVTALAVLLLQYSRRRTAQSRGIIVGLGFLLASIIVATPYHTLIARSYPLGNTSLILQPQPRQASPSQQPYPSDVVALRFPFSVSGVPQGSFIEIRGHDLTLTNPQGMVWDSGWDHNRDFIFPEQRTAFLDIYIKRKVFDGMKDSRVHAKLQLAFAQFRDTGQRTLVVPSEEFTLPELGLCSARTSAMSALNCRIPPHQSPALLVTAEATAITCPLDQRQRPPIFGEVARSFLSQSSVAPGISPIYNTGVALRTWAGSPVESYGICPGTTLTLSHPEELGGARIELNLETLLLSDYQL